MHRNLDPALHQFERAHEYQRAVNAAKLDRVFSRPFVAALTHEDGVCCLAKNKRRVNSLLAGSADGEIKVWDVALVRARRPASRRTWAVPAPSLPIRPPLTLAPFSVTRSGDVCGDWWGTARPSTAWR